MAEVPNLIEVFQLLAAGVVGGVIAFLFEHFEWFQNLKSEYKWWLVLSMSVGLPLIAQLLLQFVPVDAWAMLEPYWRSIALGFVTWLGGQFAHLAHKSKK